MLVPQSLDYTDKDFASIVARLRNLIRSVFPTWTDYNVANFGNILLELYGFVGDVVTVYQDNQANESRFATATQRVNLIALAKLIGYKPPGASAATVDETFTLASAAAGDVVLPAGSKMRTAEITAPVVFQLLAELTIPAGQTTGTATIENSEAQEDTFTSTGKANQEFVLSATPYLDESAAPVAGNGAYTEVDNFLRSGPTDRHFTVTVDQNDRAKLRFGNGVNGALPFGTVTTPYKTGGGAAGIVESGTITKLDDTFADAFGTPVSITITNPLASAGGLDRKSVAQIKQLAPASLRSLERSVAREDFETNVLRLSSIARALMTTSNEDSGIPENQGILYVIPAGGGTASDGLLTEAHDYIVANYPPTLTFTFDVQNAVYKTMNFYIVAYFRQGVTPASGAAAIRTKLEEFFSAEAEDGTLNDEINFGYYLKDENGEPAESFAYSDLFDAVRDVAEVRKIGDRVTDFTINDEHKDVPLEPREFPKLGTVTIIDGSTGDTL